MNQIVDNFLVLRDKFMHNMHLMQARFPYSACSPFTKNKEKITKIKKLEI